MELRDSKSAAKSLKWLLRNPMILAASLTFSSGVVPARAEGDRVLLAWDPNAELDVAGYRLYYGLEGGRFDSVIDCGNVTATVATNLHAGRTYGFYVKCYNTLGLESDPSESVFYAVAGVDHPPVAFSASFEVQEGEVKEIELTGADADGDSLSFSIIDPSVLSSLGGLPPRVVYRAPIGYTGGDAFQFRVHDGYRWSAPAEIQIEILRTANASRVSLFAMEDRVEELTLPATDPWGAGLTYAVTTPPRHGKLEVDVAAPTVVYRPDKDYFGPDDFVLTTTHSDATVSRVLVSVTVAPVNDPPTAESQQLRLDIGDPTFIPLLGADVDSEVLTFRILTRPSHGVLSGIPPDVTYTSGGGFAGVDSFVFEVDDGTDVSGPATVTLMVPVGAGPDQIVTLPGNALLRGSLHDEGWPSSEHPLEARWRQFLGPTPATISDPFSTTTRVFFDSPGTYAFQLRAADGVFGSVGTVSVQVNTLAPGPTNAYPWVLYLEGSSGRLVPPRQVFTNSLALAFSPTRLATSAADLGEITWDFAVPEATEYILWCRVPARSATQDSFVVSINSLPETQDIADLGEEEFEGDWKWTLVPGRGGGDLGEAFAYALNPRVFHLAAGQHSVTFRGREIDTQLDAVIVTNDPTFDPRDAEQNGDPPALSIAVLPMGDLELRWASIPGRHYRVRSSEELALPHETWEPVGEVLRATDVVSSLTVPEAAPNRPRFYRVALLP